MADQNLPEIYIDNPVTLDPGDLLYTVENTGTTPDDGAFKAGQIMRDYYMISVTVSSNDLVVALKHLDGTDPSTDRPLYFKIGGSLRAVTAALSVTKADGTNWANLGGTGLATVAKKLIVYLVWNTNLAPDAVDIFWARKPEGKLYSDFSATTTNKDYAAINGTAPASTDECINIGMFTATLGASATYLWTVPTFTNLNKIDRPYFPDGYHGYSLIGQLTTAFNPADATTYIFGADFTAGTTVTNRKLFVPETGVITKTSVFCRATVGDNNSSTMYVRLNDTTDYTIGTVALDASPALVSNADMHVPVTGDWTDYINIKWITPTWPTTNPTSFLCFFIFYIQDI